MKKRRGGGEEGKETIIIDLSRYLCVVCELLVLLLFGRFRLIAIRVAAIHAVDAAGLLFFRDIEYRREH